MKPRLSKAAIRLREQMDDSFPDRDRSSDGWLGDTRHAARKSDHNPDEQGWVRAIDIDADLFGVGVKFESYVSLKKKHESRTSFGTAELPHQSLTGNGASTAARTNTSTTSTSALRKKLTYWVNFMKYL